jgi:hypothetical protein
MAFFFFLNLGIKFVGKYSSKHFITASVLKPWLQI